jgi:hypothetical protein
MTRDLLHRAADEVDAGRNRSTDAEARDRLGTLSDQLRSQAERDTTPALGVLDRIQHALREISAETDDETIGDHLGTARERILSFLETLDDRGMRQHGGDRNGRSNGPA